MGGRRSGTGASKELSAQVVLRTPAGVDLVAEQIDRWRPSADDVERVVKYFRDAGFTAGPMVGISLSITAPEATFQGVFGVKRPPREFPLGKLPADVRSLLQAVVFSEPPDFGPGNP
jgi:hypothetical protein